MRINSDQSTPVSREQALAIVIQLRMKPLDDFIERARTQPTFSPEINLIKLLNLDSEVLEEEIND